MALAQRRPGRHGIPRAEAAEAPESRRSAFDVGNGRVEGPAAQACGAAFDSARARRNSQTAGTIDSTMIARIT